MKQKEVTIEVEMERKGGGEGESQYEVHGLQISLKHGYQFSRGIFMIVQSEDWESFMQMELHCDN